LLSTSNPVKGDPVLPLLLLLPLLQQPLMGERVALIVGDRDLPLLPSALRAPLAGEERVLVALAKGDQVPLLLLPRLLALLLLIGQERVPVAVLERGAQVPLPPLPRLLALLLLIVQERVLVAVLAVGGRVLPLLAAALRALLAVEGKVLAEGQEKADQGPPLPLAV
jgi:hypothetical protein